MNGPDGRLAYQLQLGVLNTVHGVGGGNVMCGGVGGGGSVDVAGAAFIFYCDYSSERAPRMWRHVRNLDRRDHMMDYPALSFPHMYILHGGYAGFLAQQGGNGWCTGPHLRLDDISRLPELRSYTSEQRSAWQGLTLVHVRAQLEQLQYTFMSSVGLHGGQKSSS